MLIDIQTMKGEVPRLEPHLLSTEVATIAQDCQFERGIVAPIMNHNLELSLPSPALTLFKYQGHWLHWVTKVSVINNPMAQDSYQRVYWSGQGKPKVSAQDIILNETGYGPNAWYDLGIPAPSVAPIVTNIDTSTGDDPEEGELDTYDDEDRVYIQTYVSSFGEEGAPGDPSDSVVIEKPGSTVTIQLSQPTVNTNNITHTRLYRSVTSTTSDYILVAELPITQSQYIDSERDASGATLETYDYSEPDENMQGLCQMANGICAGFAGNEVMFSESYLPYAWPKSYRGTTEHEIVAIAAIGNSLVVGTKGYPYIFSGVTPSAVNGCKLDIEQSCLSAQSMVTLMGMVFYASPDGLIAVSSDGATNVTSQLMTRDQWQALEPATIKACASEGKYIATYDGGAFVFDMVSQDFVFLSYSWDCAYNDLIEDKLYIVQRRDLYTWRTAQTSPQFIWQSKVFSMPLNSVLNSARVQSPAPEEIGIEFIADDVVVLRIDVGELTNDAFRLPSIRANKWKVKLFGTAPVERVAMASSMQELA